MSSLKFPAIVKPCKIAEAVMKCSYTSSKKHSLAVKNIVPEGWHIHRETEFIVPGDGLYR